MEGHRPVEGWAGIVVLLVTRVLGDGTETETGENIGAQEVEEAVVETEEQIHSQQVDWDGTMDVYEAGEGEHTSGDAWLVPAGVGGTEVVPLIRS